MRLKIQFDAAVRLGELTRYRKAVIAVPSSLESIEDLACLVATKFSLRGKLLLFVAGFAIHPAQNIADVIRDDDVIDIRCATALVEQNSNNVVMGSEGSKMLAALKDISPGKTFQDSPNKATNVDDCPVAKRQRTQYSGTPELSASHASSSTSAQQVLTKKANNVSTSAEQVVKKSPNNADTIDELLKLCASKKAEVSTDSIDAQSRNDAKGSINKQKQVEIHKQKPHDHQEDDEDSDDEDEQSQHAQQKKHQSVQSTSSASLVPSGCTAYTTQNGSDGDITVRHPILGELVVLAGQDVDQFVQKKLKKLQSAVRQQIEFYFGERNWEKDENLREQANANGFVPLAFIATFNRMQTLSTDIAFIRESVINSSVLEVSDSGDSLRCRR